MQGNQPLSEQERQKALLKIGNRYKCKADLYRYLSQQLVSGLFVL